MSRPFGATNEPDTCLWCGRKLRATAGIPGLGYLGRGFFDTLTCAWKFACTLAENGRRLVPTREET